MTLQYCNIGKYLKGKFTEKYHNYDTCIFAIDSRDNQAELACFQARGPRGDK